MMKIFKKQKQQQPMYRLNKFQRKNYEQKKEKRAKQFIHSRSTRLDSTDEKIDDPVKPLSKTPTTTTTTTEKPQQQKKQSQQRVRSSTRRTHDEQVKHFDEEEHPVKKLIGVESKKTKNKKRFQIIGQEVKIKHKHLSTPSATTTTPSVPVTTTTPPPVVTTSPPPIVTTPPPIVETPETTPPPPSPEPEIVPTTTQAPLRTISEIIQEEAATLLSTKPSFAEETKEEISEANENLQATVTATTTTTTTSIPDLNDSTSSGEEDNDSASSDSESSGSDSDSDSNLNEKTEEKIENDDPQPLKKMKQFYENAKERVHGVFDLNDGKDSS